MTSKIYKHIFLFGFEILLILLIKKDILLKMKVSIVYELLVETKELNGLKC